MVTRTSLFWLGVDFIRLLNCTIAINTSLVVVLKLVIENAV